MKCPGPSLWPLSAEQGGSLDNAVGREFLFQNMSLEIQKISEPGTVIVKTLLMINSLTNPLQTYYGRFVLWGTKSLTYCLFNVIIFILYAFLKSLDPGRNPACSCCCSTSLLTLSFSHTRWITISASTINQLLCGVPVLNGLLMD